MLSGEATNTNFIVFGLARSANEPRSTTLEVSTLTITSPMQLFFLEYNRHFLEINAFCDVFCFIPLTYGGWLRPCQNFFYFVPSYDILFPQHIILFPQERYFVPTTLLSYSLNILFCSHNISYCSLNILLLIIINYPPQQRPPILWGQISNALLWVASLEGDN